MLGLWCKPMTATRYASIALSGHVVASGNSIFKPSETTPNNLIGRCREKSLLICIVFNFFQLLSVASPNTVCYVTMDWLPLKCMGFRISCRSLRCHGFAPLFEQNDSFYIKTSDYIAY